MLITTGTLIIVSEWADTAAVAGALVLANLNNDYL